MPSRYTRPPGWCQSADGWLSADDGVASSVVVVVEEVWQRGCAYFVGHEDVSIQVQLDRSRPPWPTTSPVDHPLRRLGRSRRRRPAHHASHADLCAVDSTGVNRSGASFGAVLRRAPSSTVRVPWMQCRTRGIPPPIERLGVHVPATRQRVRQTNAAPSCAPDMSQRRLRAPIRSARGRPPHAQRSRLT